MLNGFGISGYRSFGPDPQLISPLSQINVFAGQNNSGKSNILRCLPILSQFSRDQDINMDPELDFHRGKRGAEPRLYLPFSSEVHAMAKTFQDKPGIADAVNSVLDQFPTKTENPRASWFEYDLRSRQLITARMLEEFQEKTKNGLGVHQAVWARLVQELSSVRGGGLADWIRITLDTLSRLSRFTIPAVQPLVEAHRRIGEHGSEPVGFSGQGVIRKLAALERPTLREQANKNQFEQINEFVKDVTGYSDARLEVPHSKEELLITLGGRLRPIESVGTGIHQVIIFAVAATIIRDSIVCIEEPEIHLHPRLQKKLLSFLKETTNQYFITTHSAHFLDAADAAVFHVRLNEHQETVVEYLTGPAQRAPLCFDLGYRPSDLVQANSIVWVEGPSDRIYLNAWIKSVAGGDLVEGLHYSIMFYGGRLLSHLTVSDQEVEEFINLLPLNRRVAVVIDSDRRAKEDPISPTKDRVVSEVGRHGGLAWVTAGREIENYLSNEELARALDAAHPSWRFAPPENEWSCCYESLDRSKTVDKLRLARRASENVDLDRLDLRERVDAVVKFIRDSNN